MENEWLCQVYGKWRLYAEILNVKDEFELYWLHLSTLPDVRFRLFGVLRGVEAGFAVADSVVVASAILAAVMLEECIVD
ncbi:hypothetical protein OUZ56_016521 [Daphnia magna]|uniref:Uncharacterized protein n=1 Tax=Daphnia magna TaxID=35525 RepID=A0ABR0AQS4_9CRUS|nr:hypothetical protein OUZ56_016521 [Daphnia magna]